jgi:TPR repeat protein
MTKGHSTYREALAEMRQGHPDVEKARALLEEAVHRGNPNAAYALGVKKNPKRAIELIESAANADVPDACYDLAVSYEKGVGVEINQERAFDLYVKAMLNGEKQSIYEVGRCFFSRHRGYKGRPCWLVVCLLCTRKKD